MGYTRQEGIFTGIRKKLNRIDPVAQRGGRRHSVAILSIGLGYEESDSRENVAFMDGKRHLENKSPLF